MPAFITTFFYKGYHYYFTSVSGILSSSFFTDVLPLGLLYALSLLGISLTSTCPYYSSLIVITGAILHAPIQLTTSTENFLSRDVSPAFVLRFVSILKRIFELFFTWQAVPLQTFITFSPSGFNLN